MFTTCGGVDDVSIDYVNECFTGFESGGYYTISFYDSNNNNQYSYASFTATDSKTIFALNETFYVGGGATADMLLLGRTINVKRSDSAGLEPKYRINYDR